MPALNPLFLLVFLTTLAGLAAGRRVHMADVIMGTLVGGDSNIGTVQLASLFGLSAWWFTLGAGLACWHNGQPPDN